jgi:hypothetical protein
MRDRQTGKQEDRQTGRQAAKGQTDGQIDQGTLKGKVSLHCWPPVYWFGIRCMTTENFRCYFQNRLIQTGQTGGQLYSDT